MRFLAGLALLILAACGPADAPTSVPVITENVLRRGNMAEPETLDLAHCDTAWEMNIVADLMTGLLADDPHGDPIPGAAERWDVSADGLVWTFHLRDDHWSDGQPVTADDFVFAWRRALDPKTASDYASILYVFKNARGVNTGKMQLDALGARAVDAATVEITLEHPTPYLTELMTHATTYPVPRHVVAAKGNEWTRPGSYVGNGAYTLSEWVPNDHVTVVKNLRFFDAAHVAIDRVIYYPTDDNEAALRRFRAFELDTQERLPPQQIDWLRANMPDTLKMVPYLRSEYIVFNLTRAPFSDIRVREAISLASDRETLSSKIRRLGEPPAYTIVPPGMPAYPGGNGLTFKNMPVEARLSLAQDLMRKAGFGPAKRLAARLAVRSTAAPERIEAVALQEMWRRIYVDAEIVASDAAIFYNSLEQGEFDLAKASWGADFNDASNFLFLLAGDSGPRLNPGRYRNPAFDAALAEAEAEPDAARRGAILVKAEALALKDHPWAPLYFWVTTDLVHNYVKGWVPNAIDENRSRWLSIAPH